MSRIAHTASAVAGFRDNSFVQSLPTESLDKPSTSAYHGIESRISLSYILAGYGSGNWTMTPLNFSTSTSSFILIFSSLGSILEFTFRIETPIPTD